MPLNIINVLLFVTGLIEQVTILGSDIGTLYTAEHWKYLRALLGILQKLPPLFCFLIRFSSGFHITTKNQK
ncbi:unnamed protein product [Gulo gulo]|uniref:Uncharacterized protein n=1 Tax=Gulo gulo TaxID=48420 RepID=A0A9X9MBI6_GULGU|nr:unnamed protein product [Gulo gulo]